MDKQKLYKIGLGIILIWGAISVLALVFLEMNCIISCEELDARSYECNAPGRECNLQWYQDLMVFFKASVVSMAAVGLLMAATYPDAIQKAS